MSANKPASRRSSKSDLAHLFGDDPVIGQWRFLALVANLDLPAEATWRLYWGRVDCENRIKELKYDFAAESFNMNDLRATEAKSVTPRRARTVRYVYVPPSG